MRIGIIGGTGKNQARYEQVARSNASQVEFHDGYMTSTAAQALEGLVARSDVVVVITQINSHGAVQLARKLTRQRDRALLIVRRFGLRHLREMTRVRSDHQVATT